VTFADVLRRWAKARPDKTAVVDAEDRLTYRELDRVVDERATQIGSRVVSSQSTNSIDAMVQCFAANRAGAVHSPLLPAYREHEVAFIREQTATTLIPDEARFLLYSSGSTAEPKGCLHSDRTLLAECDAQSTYHELTDAEVFVMPSPVGHVSGLLYGLLLPVYLGATSVLMPRFDASRFLALVEAERGTFSGGATPFLAGVVDHPDLDSYDMSSLRLFPCGGADVPPDLIRRAVERLGIRTGRGYGSTEFPSITSSAGPGEPEHKRAETDGRPIGANEVRIRDGEVQARGPELFLGYAAPGLDSDAFTADGWFRTGDLGVVDTDGYLTITGRRKDIVIRSGENISARELEDLRHMHPKVAAVAVVAVRDARTGERACACIVPRHAADPPTLAGLAAFLHDQHVARYKTPEQLALFTELPVTPSGKVDKANLRARVGSP
jgi:cyclohexanecarboxylate-CoA ligase